MKETLKTLLRLHPVPPPPDKPGTRQVPTHELIPILLEYLAQGHTATLPLKGNSMRPFLCHKRDKALLRSVTEIKKDDVVLALINGSKYVLHRVTSIDGENVTLMGDGNTTTEHCTQSDIVAEAYGFIRDNAITPVLTSSLRWKTYSFFWTRLRPLRRPLLHLHHAIFRSNKILDR